MRSCCIGLPTLLLSCLLTQGPAIAQVCPPNIDFETGTFNGWNCYTGTVLANNGTNEIVLTNSGGPVNNRHTIFPRGSGVDEYGGFPVNCPNGSGYSVRLGNNMAGTEAEGISYEFTIPAGQDVYSLIYHYAVVFQDPDHEIFQQPRLELEITNVTDNVRIDCSSFTFIPYGSILPGFFQSPNPGSETPVWCKDWSAVSINLNGHAGKTIRLFFKTADCTFRRHFGYAYIDVNSECSSEFVGSAYCPDDAFVNLVAPYGYESYTWFNSNFSQVLSTQQTITFTPPPAAGSIFPVAVVPFHGYGCLDTFYARMDDNLTIDPDAGADIVSCNEASVPIGAIPKPGLVYSWSPATGLSDTDIANPFAAPTASTEYILTVTNAGGGCRTQDTVLVTASIIDDSLQVIGKPTYCITSGDSAVLRVLHSEDVQWYRDGRPIQGATQSRYRVTQSGTYHAVLTNDYGCTLNTPSQEVFIDIPIPGITYPIQYAIIDLPLELRARPIGDTVTWSPGISLNSTDSYTPVFTGTAEQLYTIALQKKNGCLTIDTQLVKTIKGVEIYVPTAFTPNNDGRNDVLRPTVRGVKQVNYFRVFNRWGNVVFDTRNLQNGWNGTLNGTPQGSQVYVWMLEGLGLDGHIYRQKGTSVLIR